MVKSLLLERSMDIKPERPQAVKSRAGDDRWPSEARATRSGRWPSEARATPHPPLAVEARATPRRPIGQIGTPDELDA
jgi:hypothetical protein